MGKDSTPTLESQLCFALYAASRAVARNYGPILDPLGVTYPQYLTMLALWESPDAVTVSALGQRLRLDSGTLTPLLKRLEAAGLVTRDRDDGDQRRVFIRVTDAGLALRVEARNVQHQILERYATNVDTLATIKDQLLSIVELMDQTQAASTH